MLTYSPNKKPRRKDRPWLLFLMALIWIAGVTFFHAPWEPYEPYVVAIVKSIINTNSWLVPYLTPSAPYLELQPFYFWLFALIIKVFHFSDIANAVRLINALIIFGVIALMGQIGSGLSAFRNGRSVIMILISCVGFINNAYQLSPNIVVLFGFSLYFYALQKSAHMPGISAWLLSIGLIFISLNFTAQFIVIALLILFILPLLGKEWRTPEYLICASGGLALFTLLFGSYVWQLNSVDHAFYLEWEGKYLSFISFNLADYGQSALFLVETLAWYLIPAWVLVVWTLYKRRSRIFQDKILTLSLLSSGLLLLFAVLSGQHDESVIFPIIIPFVLLASVEIDSIKITIVSLLNWFCIFTFGLAGAFIATLYIALNFGRPHELFIKAKYYAPNYAFQFNVWQLALAVLITFIWLFMITRKHIRGREMVTNWASGTTFVLVMFISLCLPWFNAVLSFQDVVGSSLPHLKNTGSNCIATNQANRVQNALWYYYADVSLDPEVNFAQGSCNQALISIGAHEKVNVPGWKEVWSNKRPVDFRRYVLLERE